MEKAQLELKKKARGDQPKILAKEGRLKRYQNKTKQYRQKRKFQNNEKILPIIWRRMGEAISTTGCEKAKKILEQNMGTESS